VASSASSIETSSTRIRKGVAPLRAGEGYSFVLRRLHSLSGIIPIGAFLLEHFISNAEATKGAQAYNDQVKFLTGLPFVHWMEWIFIFIPLLYHGLYGVYIWYRGDSNVGEYPWSGNWLYTAQRWTGIIAFIYIGYHVYTMRFSGVPLMENYHAAFWKVQQEFMNPWAVAAYVIGIVAASWHFSYGLWLFAAKWGFTVGDRARRKFGVVCAALAVILVAIGLVTIRGFINAPPVAAPTSTESPYDTSQLR
jgi:succinate dehydrogenase / fumarate reductase cytochrome b subunit